MSRARVVWRVLSSSWVGILCLAAALGVGAGCQSCAGAATLRVSAVAPAQDNDGTCTNPVLIAQPGAQRVVHFRWVGPVAGEDSVTVAGGAVAQLARNVTPGAYWVYGWASDAGGAGCIDSVRVVVKAPPHRIVFQ